MQIPKPFGLRPSTIAQPSHLRTKPTPFTVEPRLIAAVALSFAPVSCNVPSLNSIADSISQQPAQASSRYGAVHPPRGTAYAVDGSLTTTELDTLLGLDFSNGQTYHAMKNALGFPAHRDGNRDYYRMPNRRWIVVNYGTHGKAIGYQIGDDRP
ncbi:MAG: hypothetical protein HC866_15770 [Leptolyngbyaceae cyanobacterium RU_5_1]|nr:hypothetical protein [Leptolyngbyaceae cyanobacterium RU_5_1]